MKSAMRLPLRSSSAFVARVVAQEISGPLGQNVIVDNKPGASGHLGAQLVAKSPGDGYTLIFGHVGTFGFGPSLYPKLPYHPVRDFAPVIQFAMVPNMLVTHPSLPVKSVKDLIALAKAKPGQVNYASSGAGSASHLAVEYFKLLAKIDLTAIAYRGTSPMTVSLVSGETSLTITGVPPLMPHVQAGRMRVLLFRTVRGLDERFLPRAQLGARNNHREEQKGGNGGEGEEREEEGKAGTFHRMMERWADV